MQTAIKPTAAIYVSAPLLKQTKYSYVQLTDLVECLHSYFDGTLDSYSPSTFARPLLEWHPSNSLWGQVDSTLLINALNSLPEDHRAAILVSCDACSDSLAYLKAAHEMEGSFGTLNDYITTKYLEGLELLAGILHESL